MRRRLPLMIAFIGAFGLLGLNPPAQAGHDGGAKNPPPHEAAPAPPVPQEEGVCAVAGGVIIGNTHNTGGVSPMPDVKNHNHFSFVDTAIQCVDLPGGQDMTHYQTSFDVLAAGGTDGQGDCDPMMPGKDPQPCATNHGEQVTQGWSHSSCYDDDDTAKAPAGCDFSDDKTPKTTFEDLYDGTNVNGPDGQCTNCGEIEVFGANGKESDSTDNWVKFCRGIYDEDMNKDGLPDLPTSCSNVQNGGTNSSTGGGNVLAWGALNDITDKPADEVVCFLADLEFIPKPVEGPEDKINEATLAGEAVIWKTTDKTDCAGKKKGKL